VADDHDGLTGAGAGLEGFDRVVEGVGSREPKPSSRYRLPIRPPLRAASSARSEGEAGEEALAAGEGAGRTGLAGAAVDHGEIGGEAIAVAGHAGEDV
jgi:hypothetical protein